MKKNAAEESPVKLARSPPEAVRWRLIGAAAGRCEFRGCNKELFVHPVTDSTGNFAEQAHIVAFKLDGPRGNAPRPADINAFENLMLLCPTCHHAIDTKATEFPVELLLEFKAEHEERVAAVAALAPESRSTVIFLRSTIGGQPVDIPPGDIRSALFPRYPAQHPHLIDLTALQRENPQFFELAREQLRRELRPVFRAAFESKRPQHYSVFALAPIPVLIALGREIGDKVVVDLFQRHRDQTWRWRDEAPAIEYETKIRRAGTDPLAVALVLSLSGSVTDESLPSRVHANHHIYELTLRSESPSREFLRQRADLQKFRFAYRELLSKIMRDHSGLKQIALFPAVPAPIAIACGQELLPKAHPEVLVHDNMKDSFVPCITINTGEDL